MLNTRNRVYHKLRKWRREDLLNSLSGSIGGSSFLILYLLLSTALLLQNTGATAANAGRDQLVTVLNPAIANQMAERLPLTPRLDTLEGKTIYLVDNQWGGPEGAYQLLEEMQVWFARNMPGVKTVLRRTEGNMFTDDPELWKEISEKGDAAIVGTGQ